MSELVPPWDAAAVISDYLISSVSCSELGLALLWSPGEGNEAVNWMPSRNESSLSHMRVASPSHEISLFLSNDRERVPS